jgi:hypothetical protein
MYTSATGLFRVAIKKKAGRCVLRYFSCCLFDSRSETVLCVFDTLDSLFRRPLLFLQRDWVIFYHFSTSNCVLIVSTVSLYYLYGDINHQ